MLGNKAEEKNRGKKEGEAGSEEEKRGEWKRKKYEARKCGSPYRRQIGPLFVKGTVKLRKAWCSTLEQCLWG